MILPSAINQGLLLACQWLPLLVIPLIVLSRHYPNLRETISIVTALLVFVANMLLFHSHQQGQEIAFVLWSPLPGLELAFATETLGLMFALLASFLWVITTIYAIGYMRSHHEPNQTRFYSFFSLAMATVMAIAYAKNLFTLFVFYEILTLSTYPLVAHAGNEKAKRGARLYLGVLVSTSIGLFLPAVIWTWQLSGSLDFRAGGILPEDTASTTMNILLLLFVFGTGKAALMPVHRWLPAAMVAPTPVSALLHAVAVVKAGVFTILKLVIFIFGLENLNALVATQWLVLLASSTILVASLIAMRQDNLKLRLAYSTISQLSYILLGAFIASQTSISGSAMHMVMHAFGKITLFFCAGAILVTLHKTEISQLDGIGKRMPWTLSAFLIGSLVVIGLPPTGGTWSKWLLVMASVESGYWYALVILLMSSLFNIAYLLVIPVRAFFCNAVDSNTDYCEAPTPILVALFITSLLSITLFFAAEPLYDMIQTIPLEPTL